MADTLKKMKIVILALSILLGLSLAALAGVILFGPAGPSGGSAVVPDNYIEPAVSVGQHTAKLRAVPLRLRAAVSGGTAYSKTVMDSDRAEETVISIYKNHAEDSEPFHCVNLFPGDRESRDFLVEVSHKGTVTVRFHADIRAGYEKLAQVLKCRIVLNGGETLYDGLMRDMPASIDHRISSAFGKTTQLAYGITVYLDTSVGNEYMDQALVADFRWWVEESGSKPTEPTPGETTVPDGPTDPSETTGPTEPGETTEPTTPKDPDDGELIPPTGDSSHFCIWFGIAMISLLVNIILLWQKARKHDGEKEAGTEDE